MIYDAIVIGGGPSGLMAANILEQNKINYLLLEKNDKVGKKLLLTGGKRCNITNALSKEDFIQSLTFKHKRFLYPAIKDFGSPEIIEFFKSNGLNLVLEENFKYFPETMKSSSVFEVLTKNLNMSRLKFHHSVKDIFKSEGGFILKTSNEDFLTKRLIVATGSNAYPSTGSSGDGLVFASKLGLEYKAFTPAETYLYASYVKEALSDLQGVSIIHTTVKIRGTKISSHGGLLFTHFGLTGPAILQISEFVYDELLEGDVTLVFNITDHNDDEVIRQMNSIENQKVQILKVLESLTTKRLAKKVLDMANVSNKNMNEISKKDIAKILELLISFPVKIDAVETKEKAFVNAGGVLTKELDPNTMESRKIKGLYFIGETVDLHGPIGGYNVTIGLSIGRKCALSIVEENKKEKNQ